MPISWVFGLTAKSPTQIVETYVSIEIVMPVRAKNLKGFNLVHFIIKTNRNPIVKTTLVMNRSTHSTSVSPIFMNGRREALNNTNQATPNIVNTISTIKFFLGVFRFLSTFPYSRLSSFKRLH